MLSLWPPFDLSSIAAVFLSLKTRSNYYSTVLKWCYHGNG
jgi:hypothetical protein